MAGYYTHSRRLPAGSVYQSLKGVPSNGYPFDPGIRDNTGVAATNQVTTSFRTGRSSLAGVDEQTQEDTALLAATNVGARFKALSDGPARRSGASSLDNGHTFSTTKRLLLTSPNSVALSAQPPPLSGWGYTGRVVSDPLYHAASGSTWIEPQPVDVTAYGVKAIDATRPTQGVASLATSLAEIRREGIPHLSFLPFLKDRTQLIRKSGSEYLNIEFGWKPILGEVQAIIDAVHRSGKILRQYQRDSGKNVRRSYTFPTEYSTLSYSPSNGRVLFLGANSTGPTELWKGRIRTGPLLESTATSRRIWFSGAYTYHLQSGGSILDQLKGYEQRVNRLFGTRVTPEVIWNLAPWSWLVDWNVNLGQNIANASALASDGLVLRYGYIMVETTIDHSCTILGPSTLSGQSGPWTTTFRTIRKERFRAQPFGFGSNPASYTNRQWAILGALGMTKAPTSLP